MTEKILTLADMKEALAAEPGLSLRRRQDLASALTSTGRLLDRPLGEIPADIRAILGALREVRTGAGLSVKRLQNIRSGVRTTFELIGPTHALTNRRGGRGPAWQALYDHLDTRRARDGLTGLMTWCTAHGIEPAQVTDDTLAAYREYLAHETLRKDPRKIHRTACSLWNQACTSVPGWPQQKLSVPDYRKPSKAVPWSDFPATFQTDVDDYLDLKGGKNLLDSRYQHHACKPGTLRLIREQILRVASAAIKGGVPLETLASLKDLVAPATVKRGLEVYLKENDNQPTQYIRDLAAQMLRIARHWVEADGQHLKQLKTYVQRLDPKTPGLTDKNRAALRQFDSDENVRKLLALPETLDRLAGKKKSASRTALLMQTALCIDILLMAPMRIGNLSALQLGRNIVRPSGPKGPVFLSIPGEATKNGAPLDYPLPPRTAERLEGYINQYREHLPANTETDWLFPGTREDHKTTSRLSTQISEAIEKYTGLTLTAHQFRHLAAKLYLDQHPGAYGLVRQVLGHQSIKTTTRFYTGMETQQALDHFDRVVLGLRNKKS